MDAAALFLIAIFLFLFLLIPAATLVNFIAALIELSRSGDRLH